jgi:hypothetical protein
MAKRPKNSKPVARTLEAKIPNHPKKRLFEKIPNFSDPAAVFQPARIFNVNLSHYNGAHAFKRTLFFSPS